MVLNVAQVIYSGSLTAKATENEIASSKRHFQLC